MRPRHPLLFACIVLCPASAFAQSQDFHRTISIPVPDANLRGAGTAPLSKIIYINDCQPAGCAITAGDYSDSIEDVSIVPNVDTVISPFAHPQEVWDDTITCLEEVFAPYDVQVVTTDPGNVPHHEAILAGSSTEAHQPPNAFGVAPFNCRPQENSISFSFANVQPPDWVQLCWTVAQESAHAFGLEHAYECRDPMTYLPGCGQKFFRNLTLGCGDFEPAPCECSGGGQNSHAKLLDVFGAGQISPAPELTITYPADGEAVVDSFVVSMLASDRRLVHRIEIYINDWLYKTLEGHSYSLRNSPYVFDPPDTLPEGVMHIEVVAYNDLDRSTSASITVTKGVACSGSDACFEGQECRDGGCYWLPPTGALGDSCESSMDCTSLLCPQSGEARLCSQYCSIGVSGDCPNDYTCARVQNDPDVGVCWPRPVVDEGCRVSAETPSSGQILLIMLIALALLRRRRKVTRGLMRA